MEKKEIFLYNAETKERFLSLYSNKNTNTLYRKIFAKFAEDEESKGKDIYDYNLSELQDLLAIYSAKTTTSIVVAMTVIRKYIQWAISEGLTSANLDITKVLRRSDIKQFTSKTAINLQYISSREELHEIFEFCDNAQDSAIIALLYEGIDGKKHENITNLKISDCDFENNIVRIDTKEIEIPSRSMREIYDATQEITYQRANGKEFLLHETEYVIRQIPVKIKNLGNSPVDSQVINIRVAKIAKLFGKPFLNPKTVFMSGLFNYLSNIEEEKGSLDTEDYIKAHIKYGLSENTWFSTKDSYLMFKEYINIGASR